ncbi:MAG: type II toxin-antitoxin system Phd/YefM family antitoxin [Caldilineaceae bacterium]|nr:type II toxin-antitoxin system Phd/YefM family antitoxin [Caldilineaceae bacterium]
MDKEVRIAIGQVRRDISEFVNRVAYGGERVILTSRGRPKAALVSLDDLEQLRNRTKRQRQTAWQEWKEKSERLNQIILAETDGVPPDIDRALEATRADLEERSAIISDN